MLDPSLHTVRIFLHLLAATIWVGGQLTLAGMGAIVALFLRTLLVRSG